MKQKLCEQAEVYSEAGRVKLVTCKAGETCTCGNLGEIFTSLDGINNYVCNTDGFTDQSYLGTKLIEESRSLSIDNRI